MIYRFVFLSMFFSSAVFSQTGGENVWSFLDLDFSARSLALGSEFIPLRDGDINLAVTNPASITNELDNQLTMNHFIYPAGINYGMLAYGKHFNKVGTFTGHMRYVSYGKFTRTDATGIEQGTFTAGDYAIGSGYAKDLNKYFSLGANMNFLFSHYETYSAFGMSVDAAVLFHHDEANVTMSLVAKNIGYQFKGFTQDNHEPLPIEVVAGISYKFHHAPFRLSLVGTDLTRWDLTYNDPSWEPTIDQLTGDTIPIPEAGFAKKLGYHANFGLEILPTENFFVRIGFNYQRRNALGVVDRMGIGGFSFGTGFKIKKFAFNYAISFYSAAGSVNVFSITTNFNEWRKSAPDDIKKE
ncbi:MAG: type IX secretion system protein PorQ [Crocinitomicaceae bacterium]|nr:type IX secretion system protein PorQ [Crocinitomicaceae bacterium]